jgi:hypothetical protein
VRAATSDRGFRRFEMTDTYGEPFTIIQSSAAMFDAVWIDQAHIKIDDLPQVIEALRSFLPPSDTERGNEAESCI